MGNYEAGRGSSTLQVARTVLAFVLALLAAQAVLAQPLVRVGIEFQVPTYTQGNQSAPAIAPNGNGGFVVVWSSDQDGLAGLGLTLDIDDDGVGLRRSCRGEPRRRCLNAF